MKYQGSRVKHEKIVKELVNQLSLNEFDYILVHHNYTDSPKGGEIDVMCMLGDYIEIYEVKSSNCSDLKKKAKKQLRRAKEHYKNYNLLGFYVSPNKLERIV